tara:strand:- start:1512 stop:1715 length:204 start_codon:yes stop_codon:yes gene_type:complete
MAAQSAASAVSGRHPLTIAVGFLGAFVVGSLAVQLLRTATPVAVSATQVVAPVTAHAASLWQPLSQP